MLGSREQELTQGASIMNAAESLTLSHTPNETTGEPIDSEELTTMIQNRIEELETATTTLLVDADERDIINSIKKANREMTQLIRAQGDQSEKLGILHRKYMELFQDMKRLEKEHTKLKKREDIIIREKDAARNDMTRAISVKSKLENLCRELQRENRRIKEESNLLVLKEQQEREELNLKFHSALWDIKTKPDEELYHDHQGQSDEAKKLREKLRNFMRQYDLREIHFERVMRSKDIELQLYEAKIAQQRQVAEQESVRASSLRNQVETFVKTETELRKQLGVYVEKFRQVEETLNKSNELFSTFRREMEQVSILYSITWIYIYHLTFLFYSIR
ncbi:myosin-like coiled-coil protein-domain-containing protein [Syncephalis plumigaleata]|nr:myosin-like coiled-coil protein-domain-containing protein [Syncephalis plumigaleata]